MENENQYNSNNQMCNLQSYAEAKRKKRKRILSVIAIAVFTALLGYFSYSNPQLFKADLQEGAVPATADILYIPNYSAPAGEEGTISIKVKDDIDELFNSITFELNYSPVNALIFDSNPIVFEPGVTEFQSAAFQMTAEPEAGKLIVTIILDDAITVPVPGAHPTLFKLATQVSPDLVTDQTITLSVENVAMLYDATLRDINSMAAGSITVGSEDALKVLNAEATDDTHVTVQFSDYLQNFGNANYYNIFENNNGTLGAQLNVANVELGSDQKSVILTTASQDADEDYVVVVNGSIIESNTQGKIQTDFDTALFYGYGETTSSLSDFGIESASVPSGEYNQVVVKFTDAVAPSSASVVDFVLTNVDTAGGIIIDDVEVSGDEVTLTVNTPLLKKYTYLIDANSITREGDGASLGIDKTSFSGNKNGPRILSSSVQKISGTPDTYELNVIFDENIEDAAPALIGHVYTTGSGTASLNVDGAVTTSVTNNVLKITNDLFNNATTNFTFSISDPSYITNTNTIGVDVDDSYRSTTFWGYGYNTSANDVGPIDVINKNTIQLRPGSGLTALDFSTVEFADVSAFWYQSFNTQMAQAISGVQVVGDNLQVTFINPIGPNRHYVLRIDDGVGNTIVAKPFVANQDLYVVGAEAVQNNKVCVEFSENIDEGTVQVADFEINGGAVAITSVTPEIQPDYRHVCLSIDPATFVKGDVYYIDAGADPAVIYAYNSANALGNSIAAFGGYGSLAAESDVVLQSINNISSTQLRMNFSSAVDSSTVTPVNVDIFEVQSLICLADIPVNAGNTCVPGDTDPTIVNYVDGINYCTCPVNIWVCGAPGSPTCTDTLAIDELTVTNASPTSGNSFDLTTSKQTAGKNYFVVMDGVEDSGGKLLGNAKVLNFLGYKLPDSTVTAITPSAVTNDMEQTVTLVGRDLDVIQSATVGNQEVTIVNQSATSLTITIPENFDAGTYDITLIDNENETNVFANSLLVIVPETPIQIVSGQSKAIPYNMPNDGETVTKLWVLVEDPIGIANVTKVVVDLSQIGGPATQEMVKDSGTQPQYSQWYTYTTTIPSTISTSADPYLLPVQAFKGSDIVEGTVSIKITGDVYQSEAPVINQVYVSPLSVSPDNETPVKISAQITDMDGAETITSVIADLGSLGIGFVPLAPLDIGSGQELTTRFFQSEEFTVTDTVQTGIYDIIVTALDSTGESSAETLRLNVSTELTGPSINITKSYIAPRKSVPNNGTTNFSLHVYITDPDGVGDITGVTASFGAIGLPPAELLKSADTATEAKSAWYSIEGLTIPRTAPIGVHQIEVEATDASGGMSNLILQIDVTYRDTLGDPPIIMGDKSYTTPRVAINDGTTPITLYAFIRDDDDDLESVTVNLSSIGQLGSSIPSDFVEVDGTAANSVVEVSSGTCPTQSNTLVCMTPSIKEGDSGQWFILSGVTVSTDTIPSSEPYMVEVVASDLTGKTARGYIPVHTNDGNSFTNDRNPPAVALSVSTSPTKVEVLFNEEMAANSIAANGSGFTITDKDDITDELDIVGATINATGTIVTLSTENQVKGKEYMINVSDKITDAVGVPLIPGNVNRAYFTGFNPKGNLPIVDYVTVMDVDMIELEFRDDLKPSTLKLAPVTGDQAALASGSFNIEIRESDTLAPLPVLGVEFGESANILNVRTALQRGGQGYRIQLKDITSFDGEKQDVGLTATFKGYNLRAAQHQAAMNLADLNNDGRVDFLDFTIFSSVYGTVYGGISGAYETESTPATVVEPIAPVPDSTVPHTSEPAGGEVVIEPESGVPPATSSITFE